MKPGGSMKGPYRSNRHAHQLLFLPPVRHVILECQHFEPSMYKCQLVSACRFSGGTRTYTTCSTLTNPVNARKYGLVSISMRLISSNSLEPCPFFAASSNPCVILAKTCIFVKPIV